MSTTKKPMLAVRIQMTTFCDEITPTLRQIQKAFEGQKLDDGAQVLEFVQKRLEAADFNLHVTIDTPAGKHTEHYLVAEVILGDPATGAYKLCIYTFGRRYFYPFAYIYPTSNPT